MIHVDVQVNQESAFEERMFIYYYKLFNRYKKPIVSLAILADDRPEWRPSCYERELWGCELQFKFVSIKLLDYESQYDALTESTNPFATVILAHIASLKTRQDIQSRFSAKLNLTRRLYAKGWDKRAILDLYSFIDWVMALPKPLELQYMQEIEQFEEEKKMAYITSAERIGIERGLEQSIHQGIHQGERTLLLRLLQRKFGEVPAYYHGLMDRANPETLLKWADLLITANSLDEIFEAS